MAILARLIPLVTATLLIACNETEPDLVGGGDPSTRVPPPIGSVAAPPQSTLPDVPGATLVTADGARVEAGTASYCWAGVCADSQSIVTNVEPVALSRNDGFSISFEAGTPDATTSAWVEAAGAQSAVSPAGRSWSGLMVKLERDEPGAPLPELSAGRYVLVVQAFWEGRGDVTYGFYVERR
jgi:hypothetical protein